MRRRLEHAPELLDEPAHDRAELEQSLDQVAEVNRFLGGRRAVIRALETIAQPGQPLSIMDVGTGSADIPIAIDDWAKRQGIDVRIVAADVHPQMLDIARERTRAIPTIEVQQADALSLHHDAGSFDVVLLSLTLHHFERDDQIRALRSAARVGRTVVVNELERSWPNWLGAQLLAHTRWRGNRLTRHDGPLSVLRAFTRRELLDLAQAAGLKVRSLRRVFFFRLVLIADSPVD